MLASGIAIDVGSIITIEILNHLQSQGITHVSPEVVQAIKGTVFWVGHIVVSDVILKLGGVLHMRLFENENWFFKIKKS